LPDFSDLLLSTCTIKKSLSRATFFILPLKNDLAYTVTWGAAVEISVVPILSSPAIVWTNLINDILVLSSHLPNLTH